MATIVVKILGDGQLTTTKSTLYTVPAVTKSYVKFLSVNNTGNATETVQIFIKGTGVSRRILYVLLAPNQGARVIDKDEAVTLDAGSLIEGFTTNPLSIDYIITGAEEA